MSWPAGTGVWVVKMEVLRTCLAASSKGSFFLRHLFADPLEERKGGVPLVEVKNGSVNAQWYQDLVTADAQDDRLTQPQAPVSDVETCRNAAVPGVVPVDIGVHEIQGDAPHVDFPKRRHKWRLDEGDLHHELVALFVEDAVDRRGVCVAVKGLVDSLSCQPSSTDVAAGRSPRAYMNPTATSGS